MDDPLKDKLRQPDERLPEQKLTDDELLEVNQSIKPMLISARRFNLMGRKIERAIEKVVRLNKNKNSKR